jgi:hypothetical protein
MTDQTGTVPTIEELRWIARREYERFLALSEAEEAALASARRAMSQLLGRLHPDLDGIRPTKWMADKMASGGCPFCASDHMEPRRHDR